MSSKYFKIIDSKKKNAKTQDKREKIVFKSSEHRKKVNTSRSDILTKAWNGASNVERNFYCVHGGIDCEICEYGEEGNHRQFVKRKFVKNRGGISSVNTAAVKRATREEMSQLKVIKKTIDLTQSVGNNVKKPENFQQNRPQLGNSVSVLKTPRKEITSKQKSLHTAQDSSYFINETRYQPKQSTISSEDFFAVKGIPDMPSLGDGDDNHVSAEFSQEKTVPSPQLTSFSTVKSSDSFGKRKQSTTVSEVIHVNKGTPSTNVKQNSALPKSHTNLITEQVENATTSSQTSSSVIKETLTDKPKQSAVETFVFDTNKGTPVCGMRIILYKLMGNKWTNLYERLTDSNGRCNVIEQEYLSVGLYKMHYSVNQYYESRRTQTSYPFIDIPFDVKSIFDKINISLLISPHGYTTCKKY